MRSEIRNTGFTGLQATGFAGNAAVAPGFQISGLSVPNKTKSPSGEILPIAAGEQIPPSGGRKSPSGEQIPPLAGANPAASGRKFRRQADANPASGGRKSRCKRAQIAAGAQI